METDILLKSIHVQTDKECVICYENKVPGFHCTNCFWQHCIDCHAKWIKQSKTCPQCRIELYIDSSDDEEEEEEEEETCCSKALYLLLFHFIFGVGIMCIIFMLLIASDSTNGCEDDLWCFCANLLMFVFVVTCGVNTFVKLVVYFQL